MKMLRLFKCSNEHITERLVESTITITICEECKNEAKRIISTPRYLGNSTGKSPARH